MGANSGYIPWVEFYRPKSLDTVIGQKETISRLKSYVKAKNMPNLLLAGPAGTGKTTCVLALARDLYGEDYKYNLLELNASDERGIDVVRGKIKDFARSAPISDVPYKLIFLDESDALTQEAQQALRRTMELYSKNVRFCLSCNWSSKIIEPIQSRCALFRFKPLSTDDVRNMLKHVAKEESLSLGDDAVEALIEISEGDMRKAINLLQAISFTTKNITEKEVYGVVSAANPAEIKKMIDTAMGGNFKEARSLLNKLMIDHGLSGEDLIIQIHKNVVNREMDDRQKVQLIDRIGEYNFRMVEGANERIQLEALLAYMAVLKK